MHTPPHLFHILDVLLEMVLRLQYKTIHRLDNNLGYVLCDNNLLCTLKCHICLSIEKYMCENFHLFFIDIYYLMFIILRYIQ